jgi:hypothetical protein
MALRGAQRAEMGSRRLREAIFGPGDSAEMVQTTVLCQDEPQAVVQGSVSKEVLGRVTGNGNFD